MHVLITRPRSDGESLKAKIEQLGWRATLEPLIEIVPNAIAPSDIQDAGTLIATSRNALRSLAASPALQAALALPLLAVGPGTAALARQLGFKDIVEGDGTGVSLVPEIVRLSKTNAGTFIHLAGDVLAFDLAAALAPERIPIRTLIVYRSIAARTFTPQVAEALRNGDIDVVALMSPRTAETWAQLAGSLSPSVDFSALTYACLSENVAKALSVRLPAQNIVIADRPNLDELFVVLKRLAAQPEPG
ncbi:MAG TPA: uroporphyrinogen-III synthase [Hyphomicrobium sp.]|nr:uroporphyrinogen-III synthase [Hyphomicrobium sp.]